MTGNRERGTGNGWDHYEIRDRLGGRMGVGIRGRYAFQSKVEIGRKAE